MYTAASSRYRLGSQRAQRRGVVLVLAVFAVALLVVLAVAIGAVVRVELLTSRLSLDRIQGLYLAEAGVDVARALLMYDDQNVDALTDTWGPASELLLDQPQPLGAGSFRLRVHDACGRIDINEADYDLLFRLTNSPVAAASIIDWRDRGDAPLPDGAEAEHYAALPNPYTPRNAPFQSVGELMLVRGVTPEIFFGTPEQPGLWEFVTVQSLSPNTNAAGEQRVNLNEFTAWDNEAFREMIMARLGFALTMYEANEIFRGLAELKALGLEGYASFSQLASAAGLDYEKIAQIADEVTLESGLEVSGKVNVNTASLAALAALPGSSPGVAEAVVASRQGAPFQSRSEVADLLLEACAGPEQFLQMLGWVTTKSATFIVESSGRGDAARASRTIRALVRRVRDVVVVDRQVEQDWPMPPPAETAMQVARR